MTKISKDKQLKNKQFHESSSCCCDPSLCTCIYHYHIAEDNDDAYKEDRVPEGAD